MKANEFWMTEEQGGYTVAGDLLTVVPKKSINTVKNRKGVVVRTQNNALETTGYRWTLHYFAGLQETQLVLQTRAETNRDGAFASNDLFPNS
jgi:predicted secreted protein